ncbi:hypothetical protein HAX54_008148 [Datura stramonium]|uniref:Uncharacterized protein n=1 Tax=Datura stramonium TaxID=4076 RepID=A0ABS8RV97_DATST|nr:hypothetical protein [Datura stramonium]
MFPFGNSSNGNPILHCSVPPSFQSSNSSFLGLNGNQILLHQHQDHHYLAPNAQLIDNNSSGVFATNNGVNSNKSNKIKKPMKKDRHSKILTSQGHRDRRVRLSIGVARKFFDLQDMLGFDKPSKTLDWLFTKSKLAVDKLTHDKNAANKIKTSTTPSSINSEEVDAVVVPGKQVQKEEEAIVARESRAKARARARERTTKKIWSQIEAKSNTSSSSLLLKEQTKMEAIKNMNKSASTYLGFHCPEEACCCSTPRNWDHDGVNRTIMTSGLSAPMVATNICCTSSQDGSCKGNHRTMAGSLFVGTLSLEMDPSGVAPGTEEPANAA